MASLMDAKAPEAMKSLSCLRAKADISGTAVLRASASLLQVARSLLRPSHPSMIAAAPAATICACSPCSCSPWASAAAMALAASFVAASAMASACCLAPFSCATWDSRSIFALTKSSMIECCSSISAASCWASCW